MTMPENCKVNDCQQNLLRAEIERLLRIIADVECELNVATNGTYLPYRFAAEILNREADPN
jgi:hypothetical protein